MNVDALEAELLRPEVTADPDRWALAAYRLALARSELATDPADLEGPLDLLDRAGRILTSERAPVEHARILTAAAQCHRSAGRPDRALAMFERAADLLAERAPVVERAAALVNVGLVNAEVGRSAPAVEALDAAVALIDDPSQGDGTDGERIRLLGAAFVNRAQAHQAEGSDEALLAAADDYERALATFPPTTPQAGMAAHGLGTVALELHRRGRGDITIDACIERFQASLMILLRDTFPFQHAIAKHSLAVAYERRAEQGDLARALICLESSASIFDPRLHGAQWRTAVEAMGRIESSLTAVSGSRSRVTHIVDLLATTSTEERRQLLRERLVRIAGLPEVALLAELDELAAAMTDRPIDDYGRVVRVLIEVLMELPDPVLEAACGALCRANRAAPDAEARDRVLDTAIHDRLFGPQRVRVRDLLDAAGWVRP